MTKLISLEVLDDASHEIIEQASYYREQSPDGNLQTRWEQAVMEAIQSLLALPERGLLFSTQAHGLEGMRRIPVPGFPKHFVFYVYVAEMRLIRIVHIIHGARDLEAIFD